MNISKLTALTAAAALLAGTAMAETTLRVQTHHSAESTSGKLAAEWARNVEAMTGGDLKIEMYFSSAIVASPETFDAAASGILDCDMTNGSYQTGKNPAFQFVADTMGGYDTPIQFQSWIHYGGGAEEMQKLYNANGMTWVGTWIGGQESLNSTKPLRGIADLQGFKFRSPPGMETEIFASLGASPVVMDFTEIFTALETGIIDGADASSLANNVGMGIYDVAKHTTYPGFHSMSADHLACSTSVWESLTPAQQAIMKTAMDKLAMDTIMKVQVENGEAAVELPAKGVTLYDWSAEDRAAFRKAAMAAWDNWAAKSPETAEIVDSHKAFLKRIGLGQ